VILEVLVVLCVLITLAAILFSLLKRSRADSPQKQALCIANVQKLLLMVQMREQATGEFPDKATIWHDLPLQYGNDICPTYGRDKGLGYGYNVWVSKKKVKDPSLPPPQTLPLVADCAKFENEISVNTDIDPRHHGKAVIGFADGHAALMDPMRVRKYHPSGLFVPSGNTTP